MNPLPTDLHTGSRRDSLLILNNPLTQIALPIVSTVQFCHKEIEQIWLAWEIKPELQWWRLDVITTTLTFTVTCRGPEATFSYSSPCTRHFPLPHHASTFSRIYPLGGQERHVWQIVRQPPHHHHTPTNNSSTTSHKIRCSVSASPPFSPLN